MSKIRRVPGALLALALLPAAAHAAADPRPAGAEFPLSTCTTCRQQAPAVAGTPSGAFVTVWQGAGTGDTRGLLARFYTTKGQPRGAERLVSKNLAAEQYDAAAVADAKNNYVVAWSEVEKGNSDVLVQRYKSTGAAIGTAIRVNVDNPADPEPAADYAPAVATTANGGFVVVWVRFIPPGATTPGTDPEVWARLFDSAGKALGNPVKVSTGLVKGSTPDICIPQGAGAVVVWTSVDERRPFEPSLEGVSLRQLTTTGGLVGTAEKVVVKPLADASSVAVACGKGGAFAVAYELAQAGITDESDVYVQRFGKTGGVAGTAIRVNTVLDGRQRTPSISYDKAGSLVVVWASSLVDADAILGRRFSAAGAPLSTAFTVHQTDQSSKRPTVPDVAYTGSAGNFVVVWQEGVGLTLGRRFIP